MNNFLYYTPTKVFFGKNEEENIGKILNSYNIKKVMIHYGRNSIKTSGLFDRIVAKLTEANVEYVELGGVEPNPKLSLVLKGVQICKEQNVELILAVGGGSVLDSAKSIAHGAKTDLNPWVFNNKEAVSTAALPIASVLTLSAAGSEMSQSCVITNDETLAKRGFNSEFNRCLFAIMNPELTYSVSKFQTGCGIVDILMHTLERYFAPELEVTITDYLAEGLMKSVIEAGSVAIKNPTDYESRATLMWASSLSHNDITGCGRSVSMPVHQIEHEISGLYDQVAHGAGLSSIFASWARLVYKQSLERFARFAHVVMDVVPSGDLDKDALEGINRIEAYFASLDMPISLSQLEIPTNELELMSENLVSRGSDFIKDFVNIGYDECLAILNAAK